MTVPLGLEPKNNGEPEDSPKAWRVVKSWSRPMESGPSLSERTDDVKTAFIRPAAVREMVHRAFTSQQHDKPCVLTIDFDSAFTQNPVAPSQAVYMTYYVQELGYFVRRRGDFGMKTCGYRFELQGLLAMSMYKVCLLYTSPSPRD